MKNNTKIYNRFKGFTLETAIVDIACTTAADAKAR